jgi:hypothetical protein
MNNSGSKDIDTRDFDSKDFGSEDLDDLVVFGESRTLSPDAEKPIPIDNNNNDDLSSISHAPLNLDSSSIMEAVTDQTGPKGHEKSSPDRITHVKNFFTKLHAGSLEFLDQQINHWLKENPDIVIKHTNTTVGEVVAKKTEQNIVITVWY